LKARGSARPAARASRQAGVEPDRGKPGLGRDQQQKDLRRQEEHERLKQDKEMTMKALKLPHRVDHVDPIVSLAVKLTPTYADSQFSLTAVRESFPS
jgi:hypothetical protein